MERPGPRDGEAAPFWLACDGAGEAALPAARRARVPSWAADTCGPHEPCEEQVRGMRGGCSQHQQASAGLI